MPITQERIANLIRAGQDFQMLYEGLRDQLTVLCRDLKSGSATVEDVHILSLTHSIEQATRAKLILAEEAMHYRLTNKKNITDRNRRRRVRLGLGPEPKAQREYTRSRTAAEIAASVDKEEGDLETGIFDLASPEIAPPGTMPVRVELSEETKAGILREMEELARVREAAKQFARLPDDSPDKD